MTIGNTAFNPKFWLFSAVSVAVGFTGAASAQQASTVGDVVVTAQRRAQSVQDVPIAVSAFTAEALRQRAVSDVSELTTLTPNVTLDASTPFSGSGSVLAASIRGIGQNDFAFNFDPGVGVYLDGVYLARSVGANTDLLDVERIEVLKGPQGTLFGRNAVGGAISIVTRDPGDEFGFDADITTGSFNRFDVRGTVDLPFDPTLRASVSFSTKHRDGYVERIPLPQSLINNPAGFTPIADCVGQPTCSVVEDDIRSFVADSYITASDREGGIDEWNGRVKLVWEATPTFTTRLSFDITKNDQSAVPNTLLAVLDEPFNPQGLPATPPAHSFAAIRNACIASANPAADTFVFFPLIRAPDTLFPGDPGDTGVRSLANVCDYRGTAPADNVALGERYTRLFIPAPLGAANNDGDQTNNRLPWDARYITGDPDTTYADGLNYTELYQWGGALTFDWELAPNLALKSITAYRRQSWGSGMDLDGSPMQLLNISFRMHQHQWSQEFQLNGSAWEERLDYVLGAYYFTEEGDLHDFVTFHEGLLQVDGPNDLKTTAWAVFGHVNVDITERLGLTLGLRYTDEEKEFEGFQADTNGFGYKITNCWPPSFIPPGAPAPCQALAGFPDATDPLRFFPPGVDQRSFTDTSPRIGLEYHFTDDHMLYGSYAKGFKSGSWTTRLSAPLPPGDPKRIFGPEEATSYELGLKSEYFDNALRVNSALFFTEYEGIQLSQFEAISPTFRNAGDAEIYGGEIELQAVLGNGFSLNSSLGYLHGEYTSIVPGVFISLDNELPKAPEWQFNFAPQYEAALGNGGSFVLGADYTYRTETFNDTENNATIARPDISLLNVAATYRAPDERWEIGVGGTNVTDERYIVNGVHQPAGGWAYGTYNRPAEWYARLRIRN